MNIAAFELYYPARRSLFYSYIVSNALKDNTEYCSIVHRPMPLANCLLLRSVANSLLVFQDSQYHITSIRFSPIGDATRIEIVSSIDSPSFIQSMTAYFGAIFEAIPASVINASSKHFDDALPIGKPVYAAVLTQPA